MYIESELYRVAINALVDNYSDKDIQIEALSLLTAQYVKARKSEESEENENDLHA